MAGELGALLRRQPSPDCSGNFPAAVNASDLGNHLFRSSYVNEQLRKMSGPNSPKHFPSFVSANSFNVTKQDHASL